MRSRELSFVDFAGGNDFAVNAGGACMEGGELSGLDEGDFLGGVVAGVVGFSFVKLSGGGVGGGGGGDDLLSPFAD